MIHKTSFSKREIKKFSREVKYAEVAIVDTPDFIDWSDQSISFSKADHPKAILRPGHATLVLEAEIGGYNMSKVFMDGGSGLNLLFASTMRAMGLTVDMLRESDTGFHGIIPTRPAYSLGKTSLDVVFGMPSNFRKEKIEFEVVDWESQYHAILGRPAFGKSMAIPHYAYLKLKMPGNNGTPITVHGSFARSDNCDREFQKIASKFGVKEELNAIDTVTDHTQPPADNRNERSDEFDAAKEVKKLQEGALIEFLRERWEIFAWEPSDMPGIPRELAEHALNVDPTAKPVQQSMRRFSEPKRRAIGEEISRLRKAGFIRELKDAKWVANPVMVPKKDTTTLRMCIDYTSLNKHCPKDHFPLPRIDQIVDSTAGCDRLSFLDAYSGYNQIKLKKEDQELTAFITPHGVFCYNVMTFGLKNAGATYQRCMKACLGEHIGRNIEVYIDDIVVKTKHAATLIDDLRETFDNLDKWKGFSPEGALDGIDLSAPSEERTRSLRQEINYMVAHSLHRHSENLVNTLERVALRVIQEIMRHQYSPSGPALGTHQGEMPLQSHPPLPLAWAAPEVPNSPAFVVYKIGGDPSDCQFLQEAPKEIPHGYMCTYVPDCGNWALTNQAATSGTSGKTGGTPAIDLEKQTWLAKYATPTNLQSSAPAVGSELEKQAWLAKYATPANLQSSTSTASTVDQISTILRDQFGMVPKRRAIGYSKPYPDEYELIPLPPKYRLPDFSKFSGSDGSSSIEHVSRYLAQLGTASVSDPLRVRFFAQSLTGSAFGWYTSLPPDSIRTWKQLEEQFHMQYHSEASESGLADLAQIRQKRGETVAEYIQRFRNLRNRCYSTWTTTLGASTYIMRGIGEGAGHYRAIAWPHPLRPATPLPNPSRPLSPPPLRTLSEAPPEFSIATATTPSCCRIQGGATTSAARWNGEKDVVFINTERVTEYGGAARSWHRDQDLLRAFASGK
ncbi:hypothetical protein QYE76_015411 [Lolium multiflorum]|uniref:Uncharacterized protein n=1 Tax=Lolium multiflorum TaxID=4521 RepID=A0AAD8U834_LOLMU|nr:hypothetical protein QYE76_015411 [Lolium multiflorum]